MNILVNRWMLAGVLFLGMATEGQSQCLNTIRKESDIDKKLIKTVVQVDWNKDGVKDRVLLIQNGSEEKTCTQVAILLYKTDKHELLHDAEVTADLGNSSTGCCPTSISLSGDVLTISTSEMRNERTYTFRYDKKTSKTQLVGYDIVYYSNGKAGPKKISANCLTGQAAISSSTFNMAQDRYDFAQPVTQSIKKTIVGLGDFGKDKVDY